MNAVCTKEKTVEVLNREELIKNGAKVWMKGNQNKYIVDGGARVAKEQLRYSSGFCCDDLVELCSYQLSQALHVKEILDLDVAKSNPVTFKHEEGFIDGIITDNFFKPGDEEVTFYRIIKANGNYDRWDKFSEIETLNAILDSLADLGIAPDKVRNYIGYMFLSDAILLNVDRHLNNFGVVRHADNTFEPLILFDYGLGLFEMQPEYRTMPNDNVSRKCKMQPLNAKVNKVMTDYVPLLLGDKLHELRKHVVNMDDFQFPSYRGKSWFRYALERMGFEVIEDGYERLV